MNRIKVAFVNQGWDKVSPPVNAASIPIWTYETAQRLAENCNVVIYSRRDKDQPAVETHQGIEYRHVSITGSRLYNGSIRLLSKFLSSFRYLNSRLYYLPYALRVAIDLRQQQCDIVHIHNFSQFIPTIRAFNPNIKIVLHMHNEWLSQFEPEIIRSRLAQTDLVISCSDYVTRKIRAHFPEFAARCQTVYNGVNIEQFVQAQTAANQLISQLASRRQSTENIQEKNIQEKDIQTEPNILFVGRVSPEKGIHTLVDAFFEVLNKFPTARLFIVGGLKQVSGEFIINISDDPLVQNLAVFDSLDYFEYIKNRIEEKLPPEMVDRIVFTGPISHLSLQSYFQNADVLINPSVSETFGMSLAEAMATGTPAIGTDIGGMPEVVEHGKTGLIVPPEDPTALAEAIAQLLSDESLRTRMGQAGIDRAAKIFSWQAIATSLQQQYELIVEEPIVGKPPTPHVIEEVVSCEQPAAPFAIPATVPTAIPEAIPAAVQVSESSKR